MEFDMAIDQAAMGGSFAGRIGIIQRRCSSAIP
jgi:hypothetical protein